MIATKQEQVLIDEFPSEIRLKKILVPIDFTSNSRQALPFAVNVARSFGAKITLIHVVRATRSSDLEGPGDSWEHKGREAETEKELARLAERELEREIYGGVIVVRGGPPYEIDRVAEKLGMDLIVTATHAYTGLRHFAFGSTAEGVIHNAPCPVLVVPEPLVHIRFPDDECGFKRILVPVRLTERGSPALDYAAGLARHCNAEIILLHIVSGDRSRTPAGAAGTNDKFEVRRQRLTSAGIPAATAVSCGTPFREIAQFARTRKADLIVVAAGSQPGLRKYFGTGTAELVIRHSPCPVLVIRRNSVKPQERSNQWQGPRRR